MAKKFRYIMKLGEMPLCCPSNNEIIKNYDIDENRVTAALIESLTIIDRFTIKCILASHRILEWKFSKSHKILRTFYLSMS